MAAPSVSGAVGEDPHCLTLQDSDEVDRLQIVVVFVSLGVGELALVALVSQLIDSCLNVRIARNSTSSLAYSKGIRLPSGSRSRSRTEGDSVWLIFLFL